MPARTWLAIATVALLLFGASACTKQPGPASNAPAGTESAPGAAETGTPVNDQPVAMIASGSATMPPEASTPSGERPAPAEGVQRAVSLDEARQKVPFTLMEPTDLPTDTYMTMVQLIEPEAGQTSPDLPAVRVIYDVEETGVIVLYQSPATGETAAGEPITIGSVSGTVSTTDSTDIITWEKDGVRYEMRATGVSRDVMVAAAASLAPSTASGAATGGQQPPNPEATMAPEATTKP
jgi:hypothetical protein